MKTQRVLLALTLVVGIGVLPVGAQTTSVGDYRVLAPVRLYDGAAPGLGDVLHPERIDGPATNRRIHNVSVPTITPYLPAPGRASRTAVIIAPGGSFLTVVLDNEGINAATWLAAHGVTAFVLKYRVAQTDPADPATIVTGPTDLGERALPGIADGIRAIQLVRERAAEYGIDPTRVVMMGFSAGGRLTVGTALAADVAARPNYAATVYGAPLRPMPEIPKDVPPFFIAFAQDDATMGARMREFCAALVAAGYQPEIHAFYRGAHGFGMKTLGTTSDHWIDALYWWLAAQGLVQPAA
jgi:acetyl esterase/lipase